MSLWQAEVEKSQFSPDSIIKRKRGLLEKFLHSGLPDKEKPKAFRPHSGIEQYKYPPRPRPALKSLQIGKNKEEARLFKTYQAAAAAANNAKLPMMKAKPEVKLPKTPTLPRLDRDYTLDDRPLYVPAETPAARANIDQIANLIIQKSQLEQEMKAREARYESLLTESQNLNKMICAERDAARQEVESLKAEAAQVPPPPPPPPIPQAIAPKARFTVEELDRMFTPHNDFHFKDGFRHLEKAIRNYILNAMQDQPDTLRMVDINPSMEFYIQKHNLKANTVFGIRDIRCIVCRGFIMEFLLERVFRVFLFGMVQGLVFKEAFQALCAIDIGRGSKWASSVARVLVSSSTDYNPDRAARELMTEIKLYLAPFIDLKKAPGLDQVLEKAIEIARDCRLDLASFSLDMPAYGAPFEPKRMIAGRPERGPVAIAYSPIVTRRGNRRGCDYGNGIVVAKGKVWRDSIFSELQDLRMDSTQDYFSEDEDEHEYKNYDASRAATNRY